MTEVSLSRIPVFTEGIGGRPDLRLIQGEKDAIPDFTDFDSYFERRAGLNDAVKIPESDLKAIHGQSGNWLMRYGPLSVSRGEFSAHEYASTDMAIAGEKIRKVSDYVRENVIGVSELELEVTERFLQVAEAMYGRIPEDRHRQHPAADGSFAFIVPTRMSRNSTEYGQEVERAIPVLRYMPKEMRAALLVGIPPFVIDRYGVDEFNRRGYLVFAPVFEDSQADTGSIGAARKIARSQVDKTVDFAYGSLGATFVGLGATLPSITNYGSTVRNPNVVLTTGHAGTVQLVLDTVRNSAAEKSLALSDASIGVLGMGAIGKAIALSIRKEYPDTGINLYDRNKTALKGVAAEIAGRPVDGIGAIIKESDLIISAITGKVDLEIEGIHDMAGKIIVDDSQPAAFSLSQIAEKGGSMAWVIGTSDAIARDDYTYGDTVAGLHDVFGCEAEVAVLSAHYNTLIAAGMHPDEAREAIRAYAVQDAVTPQAVKPINTLFKMYGVSAARLQAAGQYQ